MTGIDPRDAARLELVLELIDHIERRLEGMSLAQFAQDRDEVDLTAYRLAAIGEATNGLSGALKQRHPEIPWDAIYGMRNIIAHEYGAVIAERVWNVTGEPLTALAEVCRHELLMT
jgi:uncharacterized protein with HEPN domain